MSKIRKITSIIMVLMLCCAYIFTTNVEAANKVKLNKSKATIYVGKTITLKVKGTSKKVTWSSNNKKVATVNRKGKVTAKKNGTATITAKVSGKKYKCRVTVKNKPHKHSYKWVITKAATCKEEGKKVYKCSCGNVKKTGKIAKTDHTYYWNGNDTTRTHKCKVCSYTGVTEYNINGAWGYFDDDKSNDLWYYVNDQRESTKTVIRDDWGNPIGDSTIPALNKNSELDAKAKNRAVATALNFDHAGEQHECLAWGVGSGMDVVTAWTMSTSHRVAMTNKDYTQGGVAWFYYDSDNSGVNLTPIAVLELGY